MGCATTRRCSARITEATPTFSTYVASNGNGAARSSCAPTNMLPMCFRSTPTPSFQLSLMVSCFSWLSACGSRCCLITIAACHARYSVDPYAARRSSSRGGPETTELRVARVFFKRWSNLASNMRLRSSARLRSVTSMLTPTTRLGVHQHRRKRNFVSQPTGTSPSERTIGIRSCLSKSLLARPILRVHPVKPLAYRRLVSVPGKQASACASGACSLHPKFVIRSMHHER